MLLVVDNSSSYFSDLVRCLNQIGGKYEIKKHHALDRCNLNNYDGIILSGRTDNLKSMNVANMHLVNAVHENDKPLLGICYGAEIIALALSGSLRRLNDRIIGDHTINMNKDNPLTDKKQINVFECHGYYIARLPQEFESVANSSNCNHEIVAHRKKHIFGTQFHPEVSKDGLEILNNFVSLTKQ
jgi:GMP synthase (glutamine-hydrolysing)